MNTAEAREEGPAKEDTVIDSRSVVALGVGTILRLRKAL